MGEYRPGAHSVFEIHLHLVWVMKSRKPMRTGQVGVRVRDLIREICGTCDVLIIRGRVSEDHVHLLVSIPPQVTISRLVPRLKGKAAYKLMQESRTSAGSSGGGTYGRGGTSAAAAGT